MHLNVKFQAETSALVSMEAAAHRFGNGLAKKAMASTLNHTGQKALTVVKREIRKNSSINAKHINEAVKLHKASDRTLTVLIRGEHKPLSLRYFSPRQLKSGTSAMIWGRRQKQRGAFIISPLFGHVFKNTHHFSKKSGRNNKLKKLWGPILPKEMVTQEVVDLFEGQFVNASDRFLHELTRRMNA